MKYVLLSIFLLLEHTILGGSVKFTILQTTDIHCCFTDSHGGWLKLATVIKRERKKAGGQESCLLIDCGDTVQGSLVGWFSKGMIAVDAMNYLDYDIWVIGNHEFDFGLKNLNSLIDKTSATPLAANLKLSIVLHQNDKMFF